MSDIVYKIFPRYYYPKYTDEQIRRGAGMLEMTVKGRITFTNYESVQFIDCGSELEHIFCPWCGREVDMEFWQKAMSAAYDGSAFKYLGVGMPCCHQPSSLDELIYVKPCGFAAFVIEVWNPEEMPSVVDLHEMGKCFGNVHFFRMISVRV